MIGMLTRAFSGISKAAGGVSNATAGLMNRAPGVFGSIGMFGSSVGIGAMMTGKKTLDMMQQGTAISTPLTQPKGTTKAYGKRGIDANRLNTDGLVQNLHSNRRKF